MFDSDKLMLIIPKSFVLKTNVLITGCKLNFNKSLMSFFFSCNSLNLLLILELVDRFES